MREAPYIVKTSESFDGVSGRQFPIHDGYYFTMEPYQPVWWRIGLPTVVVATIYTPQGEALLTGRFYNIPRFSILPTGAGRYLLDVNHRIVPAFEMTSGALFDVTKREDMTHIAPGIYLLENGSLTQLIDGYNDALRLRYLKDSKKWVRSIQGNRKD